MTRFDLSPRAAFSGRSLPQPAGLGVVVSPRESVAIATVIARNGQRHALVGRVRDRFGLELPVGARRAAAGGVSFVGTAPSTWLAMQEEGGDRFAGTLAEALHGVASVSDQSGAYAVLGLSGPRVRDALCKLISVDLHPRAFAVGQAAAAAAGHMGVVLWRLEDRDPALGAFEVAVYRSYAGSFWRALCESAAEFGMAWE